ncbi:MAG: ThuA domain-containing protein [Bacteroidota bacterium]
MKKILVLLLLTYVVLVGYGQDKIQVLIIDGQNNHAVWPKSTIMMKQYLEETDKFQVAVERSHYLWKANREKDFLELAGSGQEVDLKNPKQDSSFAPNFKAYDVVISNFGWKAADWPEKTKLAFEEYVAKGGGFVSVHAADNSFPEWEAYNEMIGLGGWGGRNEKDGPYVYYSNEGELVRDSTAGNCGAHGKPHSFPVTIREDHPITQGMPKVWMHTKDECYAKLRGPAKNMIVLATAKDQNEDAPTDRHEPALMVLNYKRGRIFHTTLGHDTPAFEGVGFIISFLRGVEWAATGAVTIPIPDDFPDDSRATSRSFSLLNR